MKRYRHDRSNLRLQSMNLGPIYPTVAHHCVAGTTLVGGVSAGIQLAPLAQQALTQIRAKTWAISAPDRILWQDAEDFYTGGETGDIRPTVPYIMSPADGGWPVGSLADYLGFPTGVPNLKCNALPFRLYAFWWNEKIRDPQLQDPLPLSFASGEDTTTNTELQLVNWSKDMFTTAKLEPMLGNEAVIPIAQSAPLKPDRLPVQSGNGPTSYKWTGASGYFTVNANNTGLNFSINMPSSGYCWPVTNGTVYVENQKLDSMYIGSRAPAVTSYSVKFSTASNSPWFDLYKSDVLVPGSAYNASSQMTIQSFAEYVQLSDGRADLTNATGILPTDFNFAMAQNRWKTRRNLFGSTFKDLLAFWGIRYSDRRLQLPETLKTGYRNIDISGVLQTSPGTDSYVGQIAGRGTGFVNCQYKTWFEEPTTVIHLMSLFPATLYVNMNPPEWQFEVREDTYTPEFAHVGMVAEPCGTLTPTGTDADKRIFGYRNRYDEMRAGFNSVAGSMKTTNQSFHQGRMFDGTVSLSGDFLAVNASPRIFADMEGIQVEAVAVRNTFIEKNMVTPDGNPRF